MKPKSSKKKQKTTARVRPSERVKSWNRCDVCGRFISYNAFDCGFAVRKMVTPDSGNSAEDYVTLCGRCRVWLGNRRIINDFRRLKKDEKVKKSVDVAATQYRLVT